MKRKHVQLTYILGDVLLGIISMLVAIVLRTEGDLSLL